MENGTPVQKTQMQIISELSISSSITIGIDNLINGISDGLFANVAEMITVAKDSGFGLLVNLNGAGLRTDTGRFG